MLSLLYFVAFLVLYRDPSKDTGLGAAERRQPAAGVNLLVPVIQ